MELVGAGCTGEVVANRATASPAHQCMRPYCVSGPAVAGRLTGAPPGEQGPDYRPAPAAPSGADSWGGPCLQPNAIRCGDRFPGGGRFPTTTGQTPSGVASAAAGSPRGSRRCFCCTVCAVEASGQSFQRTTGNSPRRGMSKRFRHPARRTEEGAEACFLPTSRTWTRPNPREAIADVTASPAYPCVRPFLLAESGANPQALKPSAPVCWTASVRLRCRWPHRRSSRWSPAG